MKIYLIKIFEDDILSSHGNKNVINQLIENNIIEIDDLTTEIIKTKDINYIINFANYVKGAPIDKLADTIIETNNAEYIYLFAKEVKMAPIDKLADAIIETNNAEYIFYFILNVKNAPINKLIEAIIKIENTKWILKVIDYLIDADDMQQLYNTLLKLVKEKNYEKILENKEEFAKLFNNNIEKENVPKIRNRKIVHFDYLADL